MDTSNNVQITVTKIINAPGRGILASGHVEHGIVHLGDVLQVYNHHPGAAARVGQISLGNKLVKEARIGDEALLLLESITETDIQAGNRLLPGEQKDLPKTDEEAWEKLPERIEPILHLRQFVGKIALLAFLSIFWIVPIFIIISMVNSSVPVLFIIGFFLFWYGIAGFITYGVVKALIYGLRGRKSFLEGQSQTIAQIMRRRVAEHEGQYGTTYTFHLQVEFKPTLAAVNVGLMHLEASVSKKLYETLWGRDSVNITYAVEDPRIFVIEGE